MNPGEEFVRQVTHKQFAPVARMMGYTVQGLKELISSTGVGPNWELIGVTRRRATENGVVPSERVNCRIVNGRTEFSVGNAAFELSGDAKAAREMRRQIAESVTRVGQMKRAPLNPRFFSQSQEAEEINSIDDQGEEAPETMIITPVAPRGPTRWGSC